MIYNGAAVREKLTALRDALTAAKQRTELDPFDEAMFNAIHAMLEVSETHSAVIDGIAKSARKIERRLR
jgi:dsDNA-specific endonuclease/ATPase MutS2